MLREIFRKAANGQIDEATVAALTRRELRAIALLLGTSPKGNKPRVTERVLDTWSVRLAMAGFTADDSTSVVPLCEKYSKQDLRTFARRARAWRSGTKRQLAISLLQWRARCRQKGSQQRLRALVLAGDDPLQRNLKLE